MTIFVKVLEQRTGASQRFVMLNDEERRQITQALGARFVFDARQNFGDVGKDRPTAWARLSKKYAKRVGREIATLDLRGTLFRSFRMENDANEARCSTVGVEYDDRHQFGTGKMPQRPFWPVGRDGQVTTSESNRLDTAVQLRLQKIFRDR